MGEELHFVSHLRVQSLMVAEDWQQGHEAAAHIVLLGCLENRKDGELNSQTLTLTSRDLCHLTGFCFLKRQ